MCPDSSEPAPPRREIASPDAVGRAALARVQSAAVARGAKPGTAGRRAISIKKNGDRKASRDPQLLGSTLEAFLDTRGWQEQLSVTSVVSRWVELVGDEVAEHSEPIDFTQGVLKIRTDSTAWATQLTLLSGQIMAAIAREVGEGAVDRIEVSGPQNRGFIRGKLTVKGRGPRDTYG